jgi:hypothetical protein
MLTDLIAANPEEADAVLSTQGHASVWPTLEGKSVDHVKLACLAFILRGLPPDGGPVIEYMKRFNELGDAGEDGPVMYQLPADLVALLGAIQSDQFPALGTAWANLEEARRDGWSVAETTAFLRELSAFAASAQAQSKGILLWLSL